MFSAAFRGRILLRALTFGFVLFPTMSQVWAEGVSLFKVVTPKDELFIGLTDGELAALGGSAPVEGLSKKIAADGQMTLWQYGVKRAGDGKMIFGPLTKVSVFAAGVIRIEPYKPAYEVVAP